MENTNCKCLENRKSDFEGFLTHRVVQEYPVPTGKILIFDTWQPSWVLVENKTLKISQKL